MKKRHGKKKSNKNKRWIVYIAGALILLCGAVIVLGMRDKKESSMAESPVIELEVNDSLYTISSDPLETNLIASDSNSTEVSLSDSIWGDTDRITYQSENEITDAVVTESEKAEEIKPEAIVQEEIIKEQTQTQETKTDTDTNGNRVNEPVTESSKEQEGAQEQAVDQLQEKEQIQEIYTEQPVQTDNAVIDEQPLNNDEIIIPEPIYTGESDRFALLDNVPINPVYPQNTDLKRILDEKMPLIVNDSFTTSMKVKAIYDYLINTCSYAGTTKYDYETDAKILLTSNKGSCTYYVAAMHYMLLYEGIDNRIMSGHRYPREGSPKTSFHRWIEIDLNGVTYMFDPEWEDALTSPSIGIQYSRYCKTHEEMKAYYVFK